MRARNFRVPRASFPAAQFLSPPPPLRTGRIPFVGRTVGAGAVRGLGGEKEEAGRLLAFEMGPHALLLRCPQVGGGTSDYSLFFSPWKEKRRPRPANIASTSGRTDGRHPPSCTSFGLLLSPPLSLGAGPLPWQSVVVEVEEEAPLVHSRSGVPPRHTRAKAAEAEAQDPEKGGGKSSRVTWRRRKVIRGKLVTGSSCSVIGLSVVV